jgi:hypothetical protein
LPDSYLVGNYAQEKTTTSDECFDKCDAELRCAAACFTLTNECLFYKFGFKIRTNYTGSCAYIKPQVNDEMAANNNDKLNRTFPLVKTNTRIFGVNYHVFDMFDTLTPSECFNACAQRKKCSGASFTIDHKRPHNCLLCHRLHFTPSTTYSKLNIPEVPALFWTSYIKAEWTSEAEPVILGSVEDPRSKHVFENTRLLGNVFATHHTRNASECFDMCDADAICGAACSNRFVCDLLKYGFTKLYSSVWTTYSKPAVSYEMDNFARVASELSMLLQTRFTNAYAGLDTVTPSLCFRRCNESVECAAASFTVHVESPQNCYFYKKGVYAVSEEETVFWVSFVKKEPSPPSLNMLFAANLTTNATTNFAYGIRVDEARGPLITGIQNRTVRRK